MDAIRTDRNTERALFPIGLRYKHPLDCERLPRTGACGLSAGQSILRRGGQRDFPVDLCPRYAAARGSLRSVFRPAPQHQFIHMTWGQSPILRRLEDPAPLAAVRSPRGASPGDGCPPAGGVVLPSVLRGLSASNVSLGSSGSALRRQRLTRLTSACFRGRAPGPISGQLYGTRRSEDRSSDDSRFPVAFRYRHSLLGRPVPAREFRFPHGRPTDQPPEWWT